MKTKNLLIILIIYSSNITAQNFAPVGAIWHYTEQFAFSGNIDYLTIKSIKDTIVNERDCQKLECDYECWKPSGYQYINYYDNYLSFFDNKLDTFQIMVNFNALKNQVWKILVKDNDDGIDTVFVRVDSIYTEFINGNELKALNVTYDAKDYHDGLFAYEYIYTSKIIEKIGDIKYFFNFPKMLSLTCDFNYSAGLRCYEDEDIGFYSTGIADSCNYKYTWHPSLVKSLNNTSFLLYPNPAHNEIILNSNDNQIYRCILQDINNRMLLDVTFQNNVCIYLNEYSNGIYFLTIVQSNKFIEKKKIIKY